MTEDSNPSKDQRARQEDRSHEFQTRMTHTPLHILPKTEDSSNDADRKLSFRNFFTKRVTRKLSDLNADDCRLFCWKDCAVYRNVQNPGIDNQEIMAWVWTAWYPHRAMDKDLDDENFFMKYMVLQEPVSDLQDIFQFHETLCEKLRELEGQILGKKPMDPFTANRRKHRDPPEVAEYRLRPTFSEVFIVLEDGWQEQGVLLVWKTKEVSERHDCLVDDGVEKYAGGIAVRDPDLVFQCGLERAMKIVISADPDRLTDHSGYESEHLVNTYGQGREGRVKVERLTSLLSA